jgi:hypothetical protein
VGKSQEIECFRFSFTTPTAIFSRKSAKLNEPGFIWMKAKVELG